MSAQLFTERLQAFEVGLVVFAEPFEHLLDFAVDPFEPAFDRADFFALGVPLGTGQAAAF